MRKKTKINQLIQDMAFAAIIIALIVVFSLPPYIGFMFAIPILGGAQITILHIPVILGAVILGRKYGWILGLAFGLGSLWAAFTGGFFIFQNPLISVLPRLIFGFVIFEYFYLFSKVIKNRSYAYILTAVLSTITHTALVILSILAFGSKIYTDIDTFLKTFIVPAVLVNAVVETILAALVGWPVYRAIIRYIKKEEYRPDTI